MVEPCFPYTFYPSFMPPIRSGGYSSFNLNHFLAHCALSTFLQWEYFFPDKILPRCNCNLHLKKIQFRNSPYLYRQFFFKKWNRLICDKILICSTRNLVYNYLLPNVKSYVWNRGQTCHFGHWSFFFSYLKASVYVFHRSCTPSHIIIS